MPKNHHALDTGAGATVTMHVELRRERFPAELSGESRSNQGGVV